MAQQVHVGDKGLFRLNLPDREGLTSSVLVAEGSGVVNGWCCEEALIPRGAVRKEGPTDIFEYEFDRGTGVQGSICCDKVLITVNRYTIWEKPREMILKLDRVHIGEDLQIHLQRR